MACWISTGGGSAYLYDSSSSRRSLTPVRRPVLPVGFSWLGGGALGTRRTRSGPQLAPGIQDVAQEWCSGNTENTKWPTAGSGHSRCGPGVVFWEHEEHEVAH
eukprot:7423746-Pyramimonas_sp.AAC.1